MFEEFGRIDSFSVGTDGLVNLQLSATDGALKPLDPTRVC